MFQITRIVFRYRPAPDGGACPVYRLSITANQVMPFRQRFVFGTQYIGAGFWQPVHGHKLGRRQPDAFRHMCVAMLVVRTAAGGPVEQAAGNIRRMQLTGILILELVDATFAAAIAKGFPLRPVKSRQRDVFPEPAAHSTQRPSSLAISSGFPFSGMKAIGAPSGPYNAVARL